MTRWLLVIILPCIFSACSHSINAQDKLFFEGVIEGYQVVEKKLELLSGASISIQLDKQTLEALIVTPDHKSYSLERPYLAKRAGWYTIKILQPRARARRGDVQAFQAEVHLNQINH